MPNQPLEPPAPDLAELADLTGEIILLRRLILEGEGSPALQRSLCETLAKLTVIAESRQIRASRLVDVDVALEHMRAYTRIISHVVNTVVEDPELRFLIIDGVDRAWQLMPTPENDREAIRRLLGGPK